MQPKNSQPELASDDQFHQPADVHGSATPGNADDAGMSDVHGHASQGERVPSQPERVTGKRRTAQERYRDRLAAAEAKRELLHAKDETMRARWGHMIKRCHAPDYPTYADYGGRGIRVCREWRGRDGFASFCAAMGPCPGDGYTL